MPRVLLKQVTHSALAELEPDERDKPLALLAVRYAEAIDAASPADRALVLKELGPKLQSALESLGMSPAARAQVKGGAASDASTASAKRDELRNRRESRAARAN